MTHVLASDTITRKQILSWKRTRDAVEKQQYKKALVVFAWRLYDI